MSEDAGGPAFPCKAACDHHPGMTLRDYFAAKAMAGLIINEADTNLAAEHMDAALAAIAYRLADAMLAARDTTKGDKT